MVEAHTLRNIFRYRSFMGFIVQPHARMCVSPGSVSLMGRTFITIFSNHLSLYLWVDQLKSVVQIIVWEVTPCAPIDSNLSKVRAEVPCIVWYCDLKITNTYLALSSFWHRAPQTLEIV